MTEVFAIINVLSMLRMLCSGFWLVLCGVVLFGFQSVCSAHTQCHLCLLLFHERVDGWFLILLSVTSVHISVSQLRYTLAWLLHK